MVDGLSSRERMMAAIRCRTPDYVPCCFMLFSALRQQCTDQFEFVDRQLEMGLDAYVQLPTRPTHVAREQSESTDLYGLPVRFDPRVTVRNWRDEPAGERYPLIHREYATPSGMLHTAVSESDDWPHGVRVPLFDDFVIPRARKHLVTGPEDLPALRHLFTPSSPEDKADAREGAAQGARFAAERGVITAGEWGVLFDAACWLCGIEDLILLALTQTDFVDELLGIIFEWNRARMAVVLEGRPDLLVRRAWYETVDFLSPALYRRLILPRLKADADQAHAAGAALGLITTCAYTPLLDMYLEAGIDVLIGVDPVQDRRADFALTKRKLADRVALWGGVNGFVTVEQGNPEEVRRAVRRAVRELGEGGGFILSPVDNVVHGSERTWSNVSALMDEWRACRGQHA
jgi:uroporphyrinogen-III decarboxylase